MVSLCPYLNQDTLACFQPVLQSAVSLRYMGSLQLINSQAARGHGGAAESYSSPYAELPNTQLFNSASQIYHRFCSHLSSEAKWLASSISFIWIFSMLFFHNAGKQLECSVPNCIVLCPPRNDCYFQSVESDSFELIALGFITVLATRFSEQLQ